MKKLNNKKILIFIFIIIAIVTAITTSFFIKSQNQNEKSDSIALEDLVCGDDSLAKAKVEALNTHPDLQRDDLIIHELKFSNEDTNDSRVDFTNSHSINNEFEGKERVGVSNTFEIPESVVSLQIVAYYFTQIGDYSSNLNTSNIPFVKTIQKENSKGDFEDIEIGKRVGDLHSAVPLLQEYHEPHLDLRYKNANERYVFASNLDPDIKIEAGNYRIVTNFEKEYFQSDTCPPARVFAFIKTKESNKVTIKVNPILTFLKEKQDGTPISISQNERDSQVKFLNSEIFEDVKSFYKKYGIYLEFSDIFVLSDESEISKTALEREEPGVLSLVIRYTGDNFYSGGASDISGPAFLTGHATPLSVDFGKGFPTYDRGNDRREKTWLSFAHEIAHYLGLQHPSQTADLGLVSEVQFDRDFLKDTTPCIIESKLQFSCNLNDVTNNSKLHPFCSESTIEKGDLKTFYETASDGQQLSSDGNYVDGHIFVNRCFKNYDDIKEGYESMITNLEKGEYIPVFENLGTDRVLTSDPLRDYFTKNGYSEDIEKTWIPHLNNNLETYYEGDKKIYKMNHLNLMWWCCGGNSHDVDKIWLSDDQINVIKKSGLAIPR